MKKGADSAALATLAAREACPGRAVAGTRWEQRPHLRACRFSFPFPEQTQSRNVRAARRPAGESGGASWVWGVCARRRALLLRADGARLRDTLLLCGPDGPRGRFRVEDVTRTSAEATPPPSGCRYNEPPRRGASAPAPAPRKRRGVFPAEGGWSPRHQGCPKGWQHSARGQEHLGPWRFGAVDGGEGGLEARRV